MNRFFNPSFNFQRGQNLNDKRGQLFNAAAWGDLGERRYSEMVIGVFTTRGKKDMIYPWTYVTHIFRNG